MKYINKWLLADVRYVARAISTSAGDSRDIVHYLFVSDNHTLLATDGARLHSSSRPQETLEPGAYRVEAMRRAYVELEKIDLPDWRKNIEQILRVMQIGSKDATPRHIDFLCKDLTQEDIVDPFKRPQKLLLLTSKLIALLGRVSDEKLYYNPKFISEAICNGVTDAWREGGSNGRAIVEGGHYRALIMPARV